MGKKLNISLVALGLFSLVVSGCAQLDLLGQGAAQCEKYYDPSVYQGINVVVENHGIMDFPEELLAQQPINYISCRAGFNDKNAEYLLAQAYFSGDRVEKNQDQAIKYLKRSAEEKLKTPMYYRAGVAGQRGTYIGGPAYGIYPGNMKAQYELAKLYLEGNGVKQSDKKAKELLTLSANQDFAPAVELLSKIDANGI